MMPSHKAPKLKVAAQKDLHLINGIHSRTHLMLLRLGKLFWVNLNPHNDQWWMDVLHCLKASSSKIQPFYHKIFQAMTCTFRTFLQSFCGYDWSCYRAEFIVWRFCSKVLRIIFGTLSCLGRKAGNEPFCQSQSLLFIGYIEIVCLQILWLDL